MIIDRIENRAFYRLLEPRIGDALEYLATTDFAGLTDGKYELDGSRMFAIVQRYRPKPLAEIAWESHRKFLDVQYIAARTERMGWLPLSKRLPVKSDYDPQHDIIFYDAVSNDARGDLFTVSAGSFVVFTPQDVHAPGLAVENQDAVGDVLKVVVKIVVSELLIADR